MPTAGTPHARANYIQGDFSCQKIGLSACQFNKQLACQNYLDLACGRGSGLCGERKIASWMGDCLVTLFFKCFLFQLGALHRGTFLISSNCKFNTPFLCNLLIHKYINKLRDSTRSCLPSVWLYYMLCMYGSLCLFMTVCSLWLCISVFLCTALYD